ncbi:MAG: hypothetical protein P1U56_07750 [Saprospiraceae bacterium]|nr:hypothetical protein [Saprospiraceae bacterium]
MKHILIHRVEDLVKQQVHHQKEIEEIYSSFSWKITSPLRKLGAVLGFK